MSILQNSVVAAGASGQGGGYNINRSLRTRASATPWLNRTLSAGNQKTWTLSTWVKRGALGTAQALFDTGVLSTSDSTFARLGFDSSNSLNFTAYTVSWRTTTQVFRDPSAWYHIVLAFDTTQATAANRVKLYVNGAQVTAFSTSADPTLNTDYAINQAAAHYFGYPAYSYGHFDGYLSDVYFIDGLALTPSSFGEFDSVATTWWKPKRYSGSYGTNGFVLRFEDNSAATAAAIGKDSSGNGNNWTPNNISLTAGVTYDSMTDVPTLTSATAANFCTWNPVAQSTVVNGTVTRSNGNLTSTDGGTTYGLASIGTMAVTSGKYYWEVTLTSAGGTYGSIGVVDLNSALGAGTHTGIIYSQSGNKGSGSGVFASTGSTAYGATYTTGDIIGVALDLTAGSITFYKNGTSQGVAYTGISGNYTPAVGDGQNTTSYTFDLNCGQRPFAYTPPTGFVALNAYNLATPTIAAGNKHFDVSLWSGTGAAQSIVNAGFQPDFVWGKIRSSADQHFLGDSVRGLTKYLSTNSAGIEITSSVNITALNANGFTLGTGTDLNRSGYTFAGWQWKGGGAAVTNTNGSISSQVSANPAAGFSVVTYTGNGTNPGATIGHGLGVAPQLIICKNRSGSDWWPTYHASVGITNTLYLNDPVKSNTYLNRFSAVSSSTFTTGVSGSELNTNGSNYVAYCFAQIAGYSAFGIYTGNGSADGPMVHTGFRPKWITVKRTDSAEIWGIRDSARNGYNQNTPVLFANTSDAEYSSAGYFEFDLLSNGFKVRNIGSGANASGGTYIYMAFAESPFKYANAR